MRLIKFTTDAGPMPCVGLIDGQTVVPLASGVRGGFDGAPRRPCGEDD